MTEIIHKMTLKQAMRKGYRVTSRSSRIAARVDRKDWQEYMASNHAGGIEAGRRWVKAMGGKSAADYYRRIYSDDQIIVPRSWIGKLKNSS